MDGNVADSVATTLIQKKITQLMLEGLDRLPSSVLQRMSRRGPDTR